MQNLFLQFKTLFAKNLLNLLNLKINAFSFVKTYDFQRKNRKCGQDFLQFIPLNAMFVGVLNHKNKFSKISSIDNFFAKSSSLNL